MLGKFGAKFLLSAPPPVQKNFLCHWENFNDQARRCANILGGDCLNWTGQKKNQITGTMAESFWCY